MSPQYSLVRRPSYRVEVVGVGVALRRVQRQGNRCHSVQASLRKEKETRTRKPFMQPCGLTNPARQSLASSRKRVLHGGRRLPLRSVDSESQCRAIEPPAKPGDGIHVPGLLHRHRLATRDFPAYTKGRGGGRGRTEQRGLCGGPGGKPPVPAGPSEVRHVPGASGTSGPHPQGRLGDRNSAAGHTDFRG